MHGVELEALDESRQPHPFSGQPIYGSGEQSFAGKRQTCMALSEPLLPACTMLAARWYGPLKLDISYENHLEWFRGTMSGNKIMFCIAKIR